MLVYVFFLYKFVIYDVFVVFIFLCLDIGWIYYEIVFFFVLVLILYFGVFVIMFIWWSFVLNLVDWIWWLNRFNIDLVLWWDNLKVVGELFFGIYYLCWILYLGYKIVFSFLMVGYFLDFVSIRIEWFVGFLGWFFIKLNFEVGFGCYYICLILVLRLKFMKVEFFLWVD